MRPASARCGWAAPCWSARPSRCASAAAIRRERAIRSTRAARRAARRAAPPRRSPRGCCRLALGTHARGSTIRPASFCGTYALKPTFGAINRQGSFSMAYSMDHLGVFAGTLSDVWTTARFIASEAGGDPGYPGLDGALTPPAPQKARAADPARHRRLAGRRAGRQGCVRGLSQRLADAGVEIVTPPRRSGDRGL